MSEDQRSNGHCPKDGCYELRELRGRILDELYPKINGKAEEKDMEKLSEKLDTLKAWVVGTCMSILVGIVLTLARFVLELLKK
jgi:hypothetical protein